MVLDAFFLSLSLSLVFRFGCFALCRLHVSWGSFGLRFPGYHFDCRTIARCTLSYSTHKCYRCTTAFFSLSFSSNWCKILEYSLLFATINDLYVILLPLTRLIFCLLFSHSFLSPTFFLLSSLNEWKNKQPAHKNQLHIKIVHELVTRKKKTNNNNINTFRSHWRNNGSHRWWFTTLARYCIISAL